MFTFLEDLPRVTRGFYSFQRFDSYRRQLSVSLEQQRLYWQRHNFTVPSDHLLVRLLRSLPISYTLDVKSYYQTACDIAYDVTRPLGITSVDSAGRASSKSWLFGDRFAEFPVCMFEDQSERAQGLSVVWKDLEALKFLRHPRTDLGLQLPDGTAPGDESGLVIYQIDLPILALQYRQFLLEQAAKPKGTRETVMQFVSKYVLANSIRSLVDIAFFNRLSALLSQEQVGVSQWRYASAIPNSYKWVDEYLGEIVSHLRGNSYTFSDLLYGIHSVSGESLYSLCSYPETVRVRQLSWLTYLAQLPFVNFLTKATLETDRRPNQSEVNSILKDLRYASSDNLWLSKTPTNVQVTVRNEVAETVKNCRSLL